MRKLKELRKSDAKRFGAKAANLAAAASLNLPGLNFNSGWVLEEADNGNFETDLEEFIVRSSFVGEDSAEDSQAGKYLSLTADIDDLAEAIGKVFDSGTNEIKKNVLVQPYLVAKTSGEYFTLDPEGKNPYGLWTSREGGGGTVEGNITTQATTPPKRFIDRCAPLVRCFGCHLDIEWIIDYEDRLWIVQIRPITKYATRKEQIAHGIGILNEYAIGVALVAEGPEEDYGDLNPGYILVAPHTNRKWERLMRSAAGLVTDHGTSTCHASIFSREIGLPAVIGTLHGTTLIKTGDKLYLNTLTNPGYGTVHKEIIDGRM